MTRRHKEGRFNGAALVAANGNVIYKKGFGLADVEQEVPNEPGTKFLIGSITKPFTAMLIFQLIHESKIRLDGAISDYLPDYRKDIGEKATIAQLLTHTSGIPCCTRKPGFWREYSTQPHAVDVVVKECCSGDLEFEPGARRAYSNSGYYILGAIIEKVSGKPYGTLLRERILDPAGMKNSGYDPNGAALAACAKGYFKTNQGYERAPYVDPTASYSAGGMYSTVEDFYLLDRALADGRLLTKAQQEIMYVQRQGNYGYGWVVEKLRVGDGPREVTAISHSGGIHGYNGDLCRMPDDGHVIALLANTRLGARQVHEMSLEIAGILYGAPLRQTVKAPALPPPAPQPAQKDRPTGKLGVGFLYARPTEALVSKLTSERDFVDLVLGPGKIRFVKSIKPPVHVVCISMSLRGVEETVSLLKESGVSPERIYVGYNPEQREVTPAEELHDFLGSLKRGRETVRQYGARFLVGPGLLFMNTRENLYPEAAKLCDAWVIQSQRLQLDPNTNEAASTQEYRNRVKKIVDLLRKGNPDIKIFVQILAGRQRGESLFTAEQIAAYSLAIEDLVDAIRIYGGDAALIGEVIRRLRQG